MGMKVATRDLQEWANAFTEEQIRILLFRCIDELETMESLTWHARADAKGGMDVYWQASGDDLAEGLE